MRNLLGVFLIGLATSIAVPAMAEPSKAINFQLTDINGKTIRLADFKGKWLLVNFWAPWCPLCWVEVPTLNELNKRKDFAVIGIGLDYGPDESVVRESATRHNLEFDAIVAGGSRRNADSPFRQVGPVDFYPTSYLYDPSGEIVMFIPGQVRVSKIQAFIDEHKHKGAISKVVEHDSQAAGTASDPIKEVTFRKNEPSTKDSQKKKSSTETQRNGTVTY